MDISKRKKLHLCFSYPYGNGFHPSWVESVIWLLIHEVSKDKSKRVLGSILKYGSCYVDMNRDAISNMFVDKTKDDWVVMIDPDIQFKPNILELFAEHIIKNSKARIIAARVNLANGFPVFYKGTATGPHFQPFAFEGLREFDLVGTGIIAIHRDVFLGIRKSDGHNHYFQKILSSEKIGIGDDFSFCLRAKRAGFKIYGAWNIFGQHYKDQPVGQAYPDLDKL